MYTLYYNPGTRATAAHMVLAEAELPCQLRNVDISANEHRSAEFLAVNPRGTVPALVCDDGAVVCETIAIMLYLSDKHALSQLAPGPTDPDRGTLLDWLVYHAVEVQEPVKRSAYAHRHAQSPEEEEAVRTRANALFVDRWKLVEQHLREAGPFHLGERFSIADIYLLVSSTWSKALIPSRLAESGFPAIEQCIRRTAERPRIAPVLEQHVKGLARINEVGVPR